MSGHYDTLIKNTTIVDGTGGPRFRADIALVDEKIAVVGKIDNATAPQVIDGSSLISCPGFVDTHSHADRSILEFPLAENLIMQGITTVLTGNCGANPAPTGEMSFQEWISAVGELPPAINLAPLAGHGAIRLAAMGEGNFRRTATAAEIEMMKVHVREAMDCGAFGLSMGLDYQGQYADVDLELVELLRIVQARGGLFSPHTRDLDYNWPVDNPDDYCYGRSHGPRVDAIVGRYHGFVEALEIARKANCIPLHIAHLTQVFTIPQPHPDFLQEAAARATLEVIVDRPRAAGIDVSFNVIAHPYSVGYKDALINSFLQGQQRVKLPGWLAGLGRQEFLEEIRSNAFREQLTELVFSGLFKFQMTLPRTDPYWMDSFRILDCRQEDLRGKTIGEIARDRSPNNTIRAVYHEAIEVILDILTEDPDTTWAFVEEKRFNDVALKVFISHPMGMPTLDMISLPAQPAEDNIRGRAPIAYGLFPYYLRTFVNETKVLSLEEAVRKATSLPARGVLGLKDRGVIETGAFADIILFDPERIGMAGDFDVPNRPPEGIEYTFVNGQLAYKNKQHTGSRSGKVLQRQQTI